MICFYGCGKEAKFLLGKMQRPCCSATYPKCDGYKQRFKQSCKPWNKGLTEETSPTVKKITDKLKNNIPTWLGRKHSDESKNKTSIAMRGNTNGNHRGDRQSMYNDIRMDSSWEVKVAEYFDKNNIKFEYGKKCFVLDEKRSYRPDFELENGLIIEVKGYWRPENKLKFEEWKLKYPEIKFEVWDKKKLKELKII